MDQSTSVNEQVKKSKKSRPKDTKRKKVIELHDLQEEVLMKKPDEGSDLFERNWFKNRKRDVATVHSIIHLGGENVYHTPSKLKYLTYIGHSVWEPGRGLQLYDVTLNNTIDFAIEMMKVYPNIHTINLFCCWTGSPNTNEESMLLQDRLNLKDESQQLSFAERFIIELAKKANAGEIDPERIANLTVVGCMGKVIYNPSGRTTANTEVRGANFDIYATYSDNGTFVSINAGKFIEKFNTLRNEIRDIQPAEKSTIISSSSSESEEECTFFSNNPFSALKSGGCG